MNEACQFVYSPAEPDPWCLTHRRSANDCKSAADARIATLEAALRPFAAIADEFLREHGEDAGGEPAIVERFGASDDARLGRGDLPGGTTFGDLRRARAALAQPVGAQP